MKHSVILALLAVLGGCAGTVSGSVQGTGETFTGTVVAGMRHDGTVTITSNRGVTCEGTYLFAEERKGEGVFQCSDGRSGPFTFVSNGLSGLGSGNLDGRSFTFRFSA